MKTPAYTTNINGWAISLTQLGDKFRVVYGKQITDDLSYAQACAELGASIMHSLACEQLITNDTDIL